jgi:subtilisin family serine protease
MSDVIAGINYVALTARSESVANVSVGGAYHRSLNQAVNDLIDSGTVLVVAAGNDTKDACGFSPASATTAITVAATDKNDRRGVFSNYGSCVDIFAPGIDIKSAWLGNNNKTYRIISGTSVASAVVAGLAVVFREQNPNMTPNQIRNLMLSRSSKNVVQDANSSNAHLAMVPKVNCGPCNEDGSCQSEESAAAVLCIFDNCTCKQSGGSCKVAAECCSNNCVTFVASSTCA